MVKNRIENKLIELEEAIKNNYDNKKISRLYNSLGNMYFEKQNNDKSIEYHKKAIEYSSNDSILHANLGVTYRNDGQLEKSIEEFEKSHKLNSNFGTYNLGVSIIEQIKIQEENHDFSYYKKTSNYINKGLDMELPSDITKYTVFKNKVILYQQYLNKSNNEIDDHTSEIIKELFNDENINIERDALFKLLNLIIKINDFLSYSSIPLNIDIETNDLYYQYTNEKTLENAFCNSEEPFKLRLYNTSYMNDPNEGLFINTLLKNNIDDSLLNDNIDNIIKYYDNNKIYLASLSNTDPKASEFSMSLWNSYANNHKGVSLGFMLKGQRTNDSKSYDKIDTGLYKVLYSDDKKANEFIKKISEKLNNMTEYLVGDKKDSYVINQVRIFMNKIRFLFKSKAYKFENEVRILKEVDDYKETYNDNSDPRLFTIVSDEEPLVIDLKEITYGSKFNKSYLWTPLLKKRTNDSIDVQDSEIDIR